MKVSAQYATTHFDDIASAVIDGEEVKIALPNKPTLKLVVARPAEPTPAGGPRVLGAGRRHLFGAGKGLVTVPTDEQGDAMYETVWQQPERPRSELFGSLAGKIELADGWDSPAANKEIQELFEGSEALPDAARS